MITIGMFKEMFKDLPDDTVIEIGYDNCSIIDHTWYFKNQENDEKSILHLAISPIPDLLTSVVYGLKSKGGVCSLSELIHIIEENKWTDYNAGIYNIDEHIRTMIICKLQDNFDVIKTVLNDVVNTDWNQHEQYWLKLDKLRETFKKIL